jgi:hypothetical protein
MKPEIGTYKVPTNVVKIPDNDTGYKFVKSKYRRFIWTWNEVPDNVDSDASESTVWGADTSERPGMGLSSDSMSGTVGYKSGPLSNDDNMMPSDWYPDPDELEKKRKKKKRILRFFDQNWSSPILDK